MYIFILTQIFNNSRCIFYRLRLINNRLNNLYKNIFSQNQIFVHFFRTFH